MIIIVRLRYNKYGQKFVSELYVDYLPSQAHITTHFSR